MSVIPSPCVRKCCLNTDNVCLGCFRSMEEIMQWSRSSDEHKLRIVEQARERQSAHERQYGTLPTFSPNRN